MIFQKMSVKWTLVLITGDSESKGPQEDLGFLPCFRQTQFEFGLETFEKWFGLGLLVCTSQPLCSCSCPHDHMIIPPAGLHWSAPLQLSS